MLLTLGIYYPQHAFVFQFLLSLDVSSHYIHMYRCVSPTFFTSLFFLLSDFEPPPLTSSLLGGSESHKKIKEDANKWLKLYYISRVGSAFPPRASSPRG